MGYVIVMSLANFHNSGFLSKKVIFTSVLDLPQAKQAQSVLRLWPLLMYCCGFHLSSRLIHSMAISSP